MNLSSVTNCIAPSCFSQEATQDNYLDIVKQQASIISFCIEHCQDLVKVREFLLSDRAILPRKHLVLGRPCLNFGHLYRGNSFLR
jgi:hypothetical protein